MATTVTVTQNPTTPAYITWAGASAYTWASPYSSSTWATAREPVEFDAQVGETLSHDESVARTAGYSRAIAESVVVAESRHGSTAKALSESIGCADTAALSSAIAKAEAISVVDSNSRTASFLREIAEALSVVEARKSAVSKGESEGLSISGSYSGVAAFARAFAESLAASDSSANDYEKQADESILIGEAKAFSVVVAISRMVGVLEAAAKGAMLERAESFSIAESQDKDFEKASEEAILVGESLARAGQFHRSFSEDFAVLGNGYYWANADVSWADAGAATWLDQSAFTPGATSFVSKSPWLYKADSLSVTESSARTAQFARVLAETLTVSESTGKASSLFMEEAISLAESILTGFAIFREFTESLGVSSSHSDIAAFARTLAETLAVAEFRSSSSSISKSEQVSVSELAAKGLSKPLSESFVASSSSVRAADKGALEALSIAETHSDIASFVRSYAEALSVAESIGNVAAFERAIAETLNIASGRLSAGFNFEGASHISVAHSPTLEMPHQVSIEFWCRGDLTSNTWGRLCGKATETTADNGWLIYRSSDTARVGIRLDTAIGGGVINQNRAEIPDVMDGKLHHVVFTLDAGAVKSYKDGSLAASSSYAHGTTGFNNVNPVYLGKNGTAWKGNLTGFRVYNRVLSAIEIEEHYRNVYRDETGLMLHLPLQGDAIDASGNANDGTAVGKVKYTNEDAFSALGKDTSESFAISDASRSSVAKEVADTLGISDLVAKWAASSQAEAISATDSATTVSNFNRAFAEVVAFADTIAKTQGVSIVEALSVVESFARTAEFSRALSEALSISESQRKTATKGVSEPVVIAEAIQKASSILKAESVALAEAFGRTATFNKAIAEGLSVADAIKKSATISRSEALSIGDELRRNADAVFSDIVYANGDITEAEFIDMMAQAMPAGYGPFVPFMEGDHDYKNAIFKTILLGSEGSKTRLNQLEVAIDVPDTKDGGTAEVTAAGATISFNRSFYSPPEVTVSIKGGTSFAIPRVSPGVTRTDFFVQLFDASNNPVAGTVTWAALGY